jgi:hypothetical protein
MTKPCLSASNQGIAEELVVRFSGKDYLPVVAGLDRESGYGRPWK